MVHAVLEVYLIMSALGACHFTGPVFFAGGRCTSSEKMNIGERQFVSVPGMTSDSLLPMMNWRVRAAIAEVAVANICTVAS